MGGIVTKQAREMAAEYGDGMVEDLESGEIVEHQDGRRDT